MRKVNLGLEHTKMYLNPEKSISSKEVTLRFQISLLMVTLIWLVQIRVMHMRGLSF